MRIAIHDYAGHPFVFELSRQLARDGHVVRHFFFQGDAGPKGDAQQRADDPDNFSVEPVAISAAYRKDQLLRRRAQDIEYGRKAGAAVAAFRPDIVLSGNTPLEAQGPLMAAARRAGAAFVFWMQDFYSLAVRKLLSDKLFGVGALATTWYERLERLQLMRSDAVVLISDDFLSGLAELDVDSAGVEIIPNWGALDALPLRPRDNAWSQAQGLSEAFVFLYSGTLGLKHDPMLLCDLADAFADDPSVRVVVAATGLGASLLAEELAVRPRPNLVLKGLEPIEALPDVLGSADVVMALLENDAGRFSVPSKVLSYLCAGRPVLLSAPVDNLAARVLEEAGGGLVAPAGDRAAFLAAARELRSAAELRTKAGAAGRTYAERTFDVPRISGRFVEVFERALAGRDSRGPSDEAA